LSRKTPSRTALNDLFWNRVSEVLAGQGRQYRDLWKAVVRDKNTYSNWRNRKTIPQISDVEEIAAALNVSAADLFRVSDGQPVAVLGEQLQLPFEPNSKGASLELEYTPIGFVLRIPMRRAS
jgi:transcriptional regulator with XRE-family HTH domain